jgi:hypothetical protein
MLDKDTLAAYLPREDSLPYKLAMYFVRLPEEELSTKDICMKWGADSKNVQHQLKHAVDAGLICRDGSVYSAGPEIHRMNEPRQPRHRSPWTAVASGDSRPLAGAVTATTSQQGRKSLPPLDVAAIRFDDHVPLPARGSTSLTAQLMQRMRQMQPGQSFALPVVYRHTLGKAISTLRKEGRDYRMARTHLDGAELVRAHFAGPLSPKHEESKP